MRYDKQEKPWFTSAEFSRRLRLFREALVANSLDVAVINRPENIYYLSGYQTLGYFAFQVLVVPVDAEPCLVVRYGELSNVKARSWITAVESYRDTEDPAAVTANAVRRLRTKRLGVEMDSWFLTPAMLERIVAAIGSTPKDCSGLVERLRMVKSSEEIAYVERAAQISSVAVAAGIQAVDEGKTDRDVAAAVYDALIRSGSEYPPLPALIAVGPQTALFHNTWSGQRIGSGDVVFLEVPGVVGRYLAPIARSASRDRPPSYIIDRYQVALESLESGIAAMRPGASCSEVYDAFAAPYARAGYEVIIKAGYSVGINFPPRWTEYDGLNLLPDNPTVLEPGMVFHTPRTIRVPGDQTAIVSETTLITATGQRVLTSAPRDLILR